jgi:hypothetical protein
MQEDAQEDFVLGVPSVRLDWLAAQHQSLPLEGLVK